MNTDFFASVQRSLKCSRGFMYSSSKCVFHHHLPRFMRHSRALFYEYGFFFGLCNGLLGVRIALMGSCMAPVRVDRTIMGRDFCVGLFFVNMGFFWSLKCSCVFMYGSSKCV